MEQLRAERLQREKQESLRAEKLVRDSKKGSSSKTIDEEDPYLNSSRRYETYYMIVIKNYVVLTCSM